VSAINDEIIAELYRELRPRAPMPRVELSFYRYSNINNTIRLREGVLLVRLSDLLEGAPENVLRAIVHILFAKIYRKPIDAKRNTLYRRYIARPEMSAAAQKVRSIRGHKQLDPPQGVFYDLDEIFDDINERHFYSLMAKPRLAWSRERSRRLLGHFDPAHNAIVISRVFDQRRIPLYVVEYLMYHEMLHLRHPVRAGRSGRRIVHPPAFRADEELYPDYERALEFLKHWL